MLFEQFEEKGLSHFSYAVGCPAAGRIAIVDPRRDVDLYADFAKERGLRISHVLETHIHADFASGARELAQAAGARLMLSAHDQGELYEVSFPHEELREGDSLRLGSVRIEPLHTPGHTPEHLSFLVFDENRSRTTPILLLSGDFLFVGSLGRPDLLGDQAKRDLARQLRSSVVHKLAGLPDGLEVYPGHGAGSMCGAGMSGRGVSTLGYERIANPYLDPALDEEAFVLRILSSVPPFPDYYRRMKKLNAEGPPILNGLPGDRPLRAHEVDRLLRCGHVIVDLRGQEAFGAGHIPGAFGIGAGAKVSEWASWFVPYETPILLVLPDGGQSAPWVRTLVRVGLDQVEGYLEGGTQSWASAGLPLETLEQLSPAQLADRRQGDRLALLDVRTPAEFESAHVEGALNITAGLVPKSLEQIPNVDTQLAVICGSGYRSTAVASVLARRGYRRLYNVSGGMASWQAANLPIHKGQP